MKKASDFLMWLRETAHHFRTWNTVLTAMIGATGPAILAFSKNGWWITSATLLVSLAVVLRYNPNLKDREDEILSALCFGTIVSSTLALIVLLLSTIA